MQSFPLNQIIAMEQDLGDTSLQHLHSVQRAPVESSLHPSTSPSSQTMSVVAQHGSQIHDLERRLQSQDALIHQLLGSNNSNNDSSSLLQQSYPLEGKSSTGSNQEDSGTTGSQAQKRRVGRHPLSHGLRLGNLLLGESLEGCKWRLPHAAQVRGCTDERRQ